MPKSVKDIANKLEGKLIKRAQVMQKMPIDPSGLAGRLQQIGKNGIFNVHPNGAAQTFFNKLNSNQPVSEDEKNAALGDVYNYGAKNVEHGLTDDDLNTAVELIKGFNGEKTAKTTIKNLKKTASKLAKKFNKLAIDALPSQVDVVNRINTATSALFFNAGGGGFQALKALPEKNEDGSASYSVYITLVDHDNTMAKMGEELKNKIMSSLNAAFPGVSFNIIFTKTAKGLKGLLKKVAKTEEKLAKQVASCEREFTKLASGLFKKVKTEKGEKVKVPALYQVCSDCHGRGKTVDANVKLDDARKFATVDFLKLTHAEKCPSCDGKRVVKVLDATRATPEEKTLWEKHKAKKISK